ncbi:MULTISPECIES: SgcJ/EcaC family oxidoreductase [unclassified Streptomyces]|uniref:SgcJ/EcaC family oxidoreductase n=1 Tax=unclassified Streptomyces TaxID=2593676 RepID=UPI0013B93C41|nr:SgcJ/EcaC family oxidoreductase [Streptomyces sp. SID7909]NEC10029.1 SgcJ/EcaC family oxidoreductase [Streptomyces sp. SID7909]
MDTETGTRTHAADLEAIREVVATVERSQQRKDPDAFLALFRPDAVWTTAHGKVLIGLDAISAFTRTVLPAADWSGQVTYEVAHVLFIRPDVAAVKIRQRYLAPDEESEGAPLYVMSRDDDGRWLLTAGQNTEVVAG